MLDGLAQKDPKTNKYLVSYKTGDKFEVDEKPMVCVDLVVESLKKIGNFPSINTPKAAKDSFYLRRVNNVENELQKDPNFKVENFKKDLQFSTGDIITAREKDGPNRHIGIVTEIGADGQPAKMIHSSYTAEGVIENSYNEFIRNGKYAPFKKISLNIQTPQLIVKN
jgi:hypothetical protein